MKTKYILLLPLIFMAAIACQKDDIMLFESEEAGIYFQSGGQMRRFVNYEQYVDSTDFSFSVTPETLTDTILTARIRTMGNVKDYPRPVKLTVDAANTTAMAGTHYDADFSAAVIPAGASEVFFPVKFHRTPDLGDQKITLVLKLEDNEHFKIYFTEQKNTNVYYETGEQIMADRYKFIVSEIYTKPSYWSFCESVFGPWTVAKFRFVNKTLEIPIEDWQRGGYADSKVQAGRFPVQGYIVRNALQTLADAGTPLRDDDGHYMQLGTNYRVDYSAYLE